MTDENGQNKDFLEFEDFIDVAGGLGRTLGNINLYCKFLKSFVNESMADDLIKSFGQEDLKNIAAKVHALKGTAANLGLTKLFKAAEEIEKEIRAGRKPDKIDGLVQAAGQTAAAVDKFIKMQAS